ncbi:hypothetical protein Cgig2_016626 [Carnegiea gigantea]|uniref:IST1 homolog n=1 Tax=Carnegiea gigantea TaxID=171969 RepID=A0A9Q1KY44_9CARY|nr:hypothetical protein Cgig2_016626 [Carnegiea gigantea]
MLDGLLGRKNFKTKCKSALTRTRTRLDAIKRKRNAMQKFLKKDMADLLKNNLDRNAYGRAEGLYVELNLSSCYNYVEDCCKCVAAHLKTMREQSECPEECKVAVSSLIYAAARFADLPELRDLRNHFRDKYGDTLEPYVSKEFVEKLKPKPPTLEVKLQVMQEVAKELSVAWDPRSLEQQLQNPSMPPHDHGASDPHNILRTKSVIVQGKDLNEDCGKQIDEEYTGTAGTKIRHTQSLSVIRGDISCKINEQDRAHASRALLSSTTDPEDNANKNPFTSRTVPAPYTISDKSGKQRSGTEDEDPAPKSMKEQNQNLTNAFGHNISDALRPHEKNTEVDSPRKVRPRPKSVRTKFLKPSLSSTSSSDFDTDLKETFSARSSREMSFDLSEGLGDDEDEPEKDVWKYFGKISPKVLSPSSAKTVHSPKCPLPQLDPKEANNAKPVSELAKSVHSPKSPLPPLDQREANNGKPVSELPLPPGRRRYFSESQPNSPQKEDEGSMKYEALLSPGKSRFVPVELQQPKSPAERKVSRHSRSSSQSEDPFSHVHPRMPDFDELAERIAVLKRVE